MKNVFSFPYGTEFTGREIKEYLQSLKAKGKSLYGFSQFLNCKDDEIYRMEYQSGTGVGERKRIFVKVEKEYVNE